MSRWGETDADRARALRNATILELWQMGADRRYIAQRFNITPQRVSQIVLSFGIRERRR